MLVSVKEHYYGTKHAGSEADKKNLRRMYANLLCELPVDLLKQRFLATDLGKLYQSIPFDELASQVAEPKGKLSGKGRKNWLSVKGAIGLMIAKHYLQLSDAMLIERLNTDWALQMFCSIRLMPHEAIKDEDLPGRWRRYLGKHLDIEKGQMILAEQWSVGIRHSHLGMTDATCYESYIGYPTDVKLIWKCCQEVFAMINQSRKDLKLRCSRANHDKYKNEFLVFSKLRKKDKRRSKRLCKKLLKYLTRLLELWNELQQKYPHAGNSEESIPAF